MAIRKDKDGSWIVDISNGFDPISHKQRRVIRKGFKTKKEAMEAEFYIRNVELKERYFGSRITIEILYQLLKEEDLVNNRKMSYINTQDNNYNKHIKDYFSVVKDIGKLTYDDIYTFRETLKIKKAQNSSNYLSNNSINKIMILLKKIMDVGIRKGYYPSNPVALVKKLPIQKPKINYWTIEEFKQFISLFTKEEYHYQLLFTILYLTGLRLGEALALTWNDIDLLGNKIEVTKNIYVNKGISYITNTKTKAGTRDIIINQKLSDELNNWKKEQRKLLEQYTNNTDDLQIIQTSPIGITKNSVEKFYKKVLNRDTSLKRIRIHDFRHSHASLLINQGEDYHLVKERLGHASITTTIDTYSHLYPNKQKNLANKLDDLL
ncbi:tyrosine-type recombinase/integrase [Streptococcus suis]